MSYTMGTKLVIISLVVIVMALNFVPLEGLTLRSGRSLLQTDNFSEPIRQSDDDTVRVDPLDGLKKYRGGYDIRNKHYWSSTVFTGVYGYAIAAAWLLLGLGYGVFWLVKTCCWKSGRRKLKNRFPCHKQCYLYTILIAIFFTILAITATGLVLGGNAKFHSRAKTVVDSIIDTADEASDTIYNTTGAMKGMSTDLEAANGSGQTTQFLSSTSQRLDTQAADIERQARKNRRAIEKGLTIVYTITTVIISFNLAAAIALSVTGILKFQRTLRMLIIFCWILTVLCWLFFGIYFFIDKFAGDTCTAIENFQQDPYNSSLTSILPCDELLSAKSVLNDVSGGIYNIVNEVNRNISSLYGNIAKICNPFSAPPEYQYRPDHCPAETIQIGDIPQLLRVLTCTDENCTGGILISAREFNTVQAYAISIQNLLNVYPGMESLVECQTVRETFSEILSRHCKPLKRNAKMVWASLVFLSVVMVGLVLLWTTQAQHEQNHHSLGGSVKPHFIAAEALEGGIEKDMNTDRNSSTDL